MRRITFCLQVGPLGDAEPVLLINHHQSRLAKLHIRLNQRLSPDHQVNGSVTNLLQQFGAFFPFDPAGQQGAADTDARHQIAAALKMLLGQNFCRDHQNALLSVFYGFCQC